LTFTEVIQPKIGHRGSQGFPTHFLTNHFAIPRSKT
jgi:hypothetical protein